MDEKTNINQGAGNNADMNFSDELQQIITDNMFWLKRRSKVRQSDLAKGLGISQPTLSQKYSRAIAWTINDLAKAAVFFEVPVSYLVTNNFIEPSSEYQLRGNLATDISHHELAAPSGVRYLRKPDENEGRSHGAIGPRAFVMPLMDVDQMNLGPRFSARTHFKLPHLDAHRKSDRLHQPRPAGPRDRRHPGRTRTAQPRTHRRHGAPTGPGHGILGKGDRTHARRRRTRQQIGTQAPFRAHLQ